MVYHVYMYMCTLPFDVGASPDLTRVAHDGLIKQSKTCNINLQKVLTVIAYYYQDNSVVITILWISRTRLRIYATSSQDPKK